MIAESSSKTIADSLGLVEHQLLTPRFRVHRVIAEGGFGVVYAATHLALETQVAVKVLKTPANLDDEARAQWVEAFTREARVVAKLRHPAIVHAHDFGLATLPTGERLPWMAMEWLEGQTLDAALRARRDQGGRAPAEALALLRPIFEAVAFAHERDVVHRDLKPANVMLVPIGRGLVQAKLMDFGIAKVMEPADAHAPSGYTETAGFTAYSPCYASPEQVSAMRTGPWTDVHALALMLSEVLTDSPAYAPAEATNGMFGAVFSPSRPTPAKRGVDVGPWEAVLERALALEPARRYANACEFLAALETALSIAERRPLAGPEVPAASAAVTRAEPTTLRAGVQTRDRSRPAPSATRARWTRALVAGGVLALGSALLGIRALRTPSPSSRLTTAPRSPTAPAPVAAPALVPQAPPRAMTAADGALAPAPASAQTSAPHVGPAGVSPPAPVAALRGDTGATTARPPRRVTPRPAAPRQPQTPASATSSRGLTVR